MCCDRLVLYEPAMAQHSNLNCEEPVKNVFFKKILCEILPMGCLLFVVRAKGKKPPFAKAKGGEKLEPYSHEHIRHSFDAYCKQILKNEAIDVERHQKYLRKHEISLSQLTEEELEQLAECDTYYEDYQRFRMTGFEVMIKNALLAEALRSLSEDRQEIILLFT